MNKVFSASQRINKWYIFILPILVLSTLLDFAGTALVFPLIGLLAGEQSSENHTIIRFIYEACNVLGISSENKFLIIYIVLIFFLKAVLFISYKWIAADMVLQWMVDTRIQLYKAIYNSAFSEVSEDKSRLINAFTSQSEAAHGAIVISFELWLGLMVAFSGVLLANLISWQVFLILIIFGLLLAVVIKMTMKLSLKYGHQLAENNKKLLSIMGQAVDRFRYLKSTFSSERLFLDLIPIARKVKVIQVKHAVINATTSSMTEPLSIVLIGILFWVGRLLEIENSILIMQSVVMYRVLTRVLPLSSRLQVFSKAYASLDYVDSTIGDLNSRKENIRHNKLSPHLETIEFQNIFFNYGKEKILENINFRFQKSQVLLVVGKSGSGKTTLLNLLNGLLVPDAGMIKINGNNLNEINLDDYRSKIGLLSQEPTLFNMSLRNNLTLRNSNTKDEELHLWLKKLDLIGLFEKGVIDLDREVNELSSNLSGGQKQRLCFIREILSKPELLILDEPTSALDSKSKNLILQNIQEIKHHTFIVIITHDNDLYGFADLIFNTETGVLKNSPKTH
jgi:subfamily B ATP-binding cassette protein MsbA